MPRHAVTTDNWTKITDASAAGSGIVYDLEKPVRVDSLTQNRTLGTPTGLADGMQMIIALRGNSGGFTWDLSNYTLGPSAGQTLSASPTLMDCMAVQRVGGVYRAVLQVGFAYSEPA